MKNSSNLCSWPQINLTPLSLISGTFLFPFENPEAAYPQMNIRLRFWSQPCNCLEKLVFLGLISGILNT